jgi:transposase-like protein
VFNRVPKADLQPTDCANSEHVVVDETVIKLDKEQYWLYAAVNPAPNRLLHVRLFSTRNTEVSAISMTELRKKHASMMFSFSSTVRHGSKWLSPTRSAIPPRTAGESQQRRTCFREMKGWTSPFSKYFSHAEAETVENLLQAFAFAWNQLI